MVNLIFTDTFIYNMNKIYKKAFKVYFNKRLKEVTFHGEVTHPLYLQVIFKGKNQIFKSYYFNLLNSSRYRVNGKIPVVNDVVAFEEDILTFVTTSGNDSYSSVDQLHSAYNFYSRDLCTSSEEAYFVQFFLVLKQMGYTSLASLISNSTATGVFYDVMLDFFAIAEERVSSRVIKAMDKSGHFYIYLYEFILTRKDAPYFCLSVKEWVTTDIKKEFRSYLNQVYPTKSDKVVSYVDRWVKRLERDISLH